MAPTAPPGPRSPQTQAGRPRARPGTETSIQHSTRAGPLGAPAAAHSACSSCGGRVHLQEQLPVLVCEALLGADAVLRLPGRLPRRPGGPGQGLQDATLASALLGSGSGSLAVRLFSWRVCRSDRGRPRSRVLLGGRGGEAAIVSLPSRFVSRVRTVFLCKY